MKRSASDRHEDSYGNPKSPKSPKRDVRKSPGSLPLAFGSLGNEAEFGTRDGIESSPPQKSNNSSLRELSPSTRRLTERISSLHLSDAPPEGYPANFEAPFGLMKQNPLGDTEDRSLSFASRDLKLDLSRVARFHMPMLPSFADDHAKRDLNPDDSRMEIDGEQPEVRPTRLPHKRGSYPVSADAPHTDSTDDHVQQSALSAPSQMVTGEIESHNADHHSPMVASLESAIAAKLAELGTCDLPKIAVIYVDVEQLV